MLCENCPALRREGYEYPEEYCLVQPEDKTYDFKDGCGCYLRLSTIEKRVKEAEDAYCKQCEDMAEWYVLTSEIEEIPEKKGKCLRLIAHSIGFDKKKGHTYSRHGKKYYKAWRNYFATTRATSDYSTLQTMCNAGLAKCNKPLDCLQQDTKEMLYFHITEKGLRWFGEKYGFIVKEED